MRSAFYRHLSLPPLQDLSVDQIVAVRSATPMAMYGHLINSAIAVIAFHDSLELTALLIWGSLSSMIALYLLLSGRRGVAPVPDEKRISRRTLIKCTLFGIACALPWAILGVLCFGEVTHTEAIVLVALLAGMAASGTIQLAPVYPAALAYMCTILVPAFIAYFPTMMSTGNEVAMSMLIVSYAVFLYSITASTSRLSVQRSQVTHYLRRILRSIDDAASQIEAASDGDTNAANAVSRIASDAVGRGSAGEFDYERLNFKVISTLRKASKELIDNKEALQKSKAKLANMLRDAMDAIISVDSAHRITHFNLSAEEIFGIEHKEALGRDISDFLPNFDKPDQGHNNADELKKRPTSTRVTVSSGRHHDGRTFPIEYSVSSSTSGNEFVETIILRDITERRAKEKHISFIMRELSHRSKNLLSVILSVASNTAKTCDTLEDFTDKFQMRLLSFSQSHELLVNQDWSGADLEQLIRCQLESFDDDTAPRIGLKGPRIFLQQKAVQIIGLVIHELATNAHKYGALSSVKGQVNIDWLISKSDCGQRFLELRWSECGGPIVSAPTKCGFGRTVIERMAKGYLQGEVELDYDPDGFRWRAKFSDEFFCCDSDDGAAVASEAQLALVS